MKKLALIFSMIALPLGFFNLMGAKSAQAVSNIENPIVLELLPPKAVRPVRTLIKFGVNWRRKMA